MFAMISFLLILYKQMSTENAGLKCPQGWDYSWFTCFFYLYFPKIVQMFYNKYYCIQKQQQQQLFHGA